MLRPVKNKHAVPRSLAILVALVLLGACAAPEPEVDITKGQIRADLREHTITLTSPEVRAGEVTFVVRNRGGSAHDFIVIKTDLAPDKLPMDGQTQKAREDGRVGGVELLGPGKSANLRVTLAPGHYVLICNVATHYELGMRTEFTVK
jgi:uncharacterized cupredoxin-like copper-binding protein